MVAKNQPEDEDKTVLFGTALRKMREDSDAATRNLLLACRSDLSLFLPSMFPSSFLTISPSVTANSGPTIHQSYWSWLYKATQFDVFIKRNQPRGLNENDQRNKGLIRFCDYQILLLVAFCDCFANSRSPILYWGYLVLVPL